jgi:hypothetical protein
MSCRLFKAFTTTRTAGIPVRVITLTERVSVREIKMLPQLVTRAEGVSAR